MSKSGSYFVATGKRETNQRNFFKEIREVFFFKTSKGKHFTKLNSIRFLKINNGYSIVVAGSKWQATRAQRMVIKFLLPFQCWLVQGGAEKGITPPPSNKTIFQELIIKKNTFLFLKKVSF